MKIILVDDEPLALEFLEIQLKKVSDEAKIKKFTYFEINDHKSLLQEADLLFLDIEMPGLNGLELAEKILEVNPDLEIVFITAYDKYAVKAFELNALDYVLKPVQVERLEKTLERLEKNGQPKSPDYEGNNLRINVCGDLTFEMEEDTYKPIQWRTAKSQELFLYLLHHTGKMIRKSELVELLWPDIEQERAYSQLYTAIYNVRKTLKEYSEYFTIKSVQIGYMLLINNVFIDIKEWEKRIMSAPPVHIETIDVYEEAMELYTGSYLNVYDYIWAEPERFRLEQLWMETAKKLANCYEQNNLMEKALAWYVRICDERPDDEQSNFTLMKLYAKLEYGLLVNYQYEQLEHALEELEINIDPKIRQWYKNWKGGKTGKGSFV